MCREKKKNPYWGSQNEEKDLDQKNNKISTKEDDNKSQENQADNKSIKNGEEPNK